MYAYEVYDFNYDDTKSFVLLNERKFSKVEYENIVNECREKICGDEWDLYENIHSILIKEYGFKEINVQYTYTLHGGAYGKGQVIENRVVEAEIE
ncbi:hypothetical protein [Clostridium beijerinckii]|uniref:hypothetical protein n=1 Tax=Clostridium beijerinckii TaxID=1520 RepID=UPI00047B1EE0|nr:hypothetical protein [Clostridium beijerinckii]